MIENEIKTTPLIETHKAMGAKLVDFSGWQMPVQYTTIIEEHLNTRNVGSIFDICHMGEIMVSGANARSLLQYLLVGDVNRLELGKIMYTFLCNEQGGTLDDLLLYMVSDNEYMLVVNAGTTGTDLAWIMEHNGDDVRVEDISKKTGKLDLQGPVSRKLLHESCGDSIMELDRLSFIHTELFGKKVFVSCSGYTGEDGFEIFCKLDDTLFLWDSILETGSSDGVRPAGLGARDTLRLEAGYCLYGHELSNDITPVEASLGWAVTHLKNDEYIGKEVLLKQKNNRPERKLAVFEMVDRGIAREQYCVMCDGEQIGVVTSGTYSPTFRKPIGLCLIKSEYAKAGNNIDIIIREKLQRAKIVKKPFYKYRG